MAAPASSRKSKSAEKEVESEIMDVDDQPNNGEEEQHHLQQEDDEEENEEEGEYEVEAIVDHRQKKGSLAGKHEYLVSWKGYGPEHNTWEPEDHVAHANDIVSRYWSGKPKTTIAPPKESKKRGRASAGASSTPVPVSSQKNKSARTTNGKRKSNSNGNHKAEEEDEEEVWEFETTHIDSAAKYEDIPDWENTVQSVDTIDRSSENELVIYLTMVGGERVALPTEVAYLRCPQKILKFYEKHLKWKASP
ncbi:uncharacterized protein IL334_005639 [Kwoniella shivajii]|uniref:Chromo domain-containing protein n=1 Tax=Kwoniella shivajii TaxID=564305 RepID=A0ABZ1D5K0_9TREE|nr:hypothetical protein IL334_005639 [Kwoniella shivajii]